MKKLIPRFLLFAVILIILNWLFLCHEDCEWIDNGVTEYYTPSPQGRLKFAMLVGAAEAFILTLGFCIIKMFVKNRK